MFKLTKEQINEIIKEYGGYYQLIMEIQKKLNLCGLVKTEDDYLELVISVVAQKETFKLEKQRSSFNIGLSTDEIIESELKFKYTDYSELKKIKRLKK